ncbi:hypothetical protein RHGRI_023753 [Rhododendron griersonianum]|uniref:NF-X1-type domain-containing protein n=1 Tax=Rhododendron griersonianum TaxID=479676 RepID=A0AAV6J6L9_9ERIC|nr:hypothetical protein RHGRI_023753 [Rhododendron griersonianum]
MSTQERNDPRNNNNRSRFPAQSSRREWVPRGFTPITTASNPATVVNSLSSFNSSRSGNGGDLNSKSLISENLGRPLYQRGGKARGSHHQNEKGSKGVNLRNQEQKVPEDTSLPQLLQEIQDKLMKGTVECMICYDMLMATKEIRYLCFFGKRPEPSSELYLTPHSCGEPCGKPLEKDAPGAGGSKRDVCPHVCVLQCHPDPCPPCKAFAPPRLCPCGKKIVSTRCSDRRPVITCGQQCEKLIDCGRHRCERVCHVGPCDVCQVMVNASCFCKKKMEVVLCGEIAMKGEVKVEDGVFSCNSICGKQLRCGNHVCNEICHPGPCGECNLLPGRIKVCYCGKKSLHEERQSCLDPIPTCSQINFSNSGMPQNKVGKFACDKPCGQKKNCGRHRCSEKCCPLSNSGISLSGDWDPHVCPMPCGKKLRTSIPPPQPCGTPPPSCQYSCSVSQPCGHSSSHSCHFGDCPPCSVPVAKECSGGHVVIKNIPCGSKDIRCNKLCGKTRQCGRHACARTCHPPPCDSSCGPSFSSLKASCMQTCGAPRRDCRHTCTALCHPSSPCPDVRCEFQVTITCSCGRITATVPCDAGGNIGGPNIDTIFEASVMQKLPVPLQPVEGNGKKIPLGQRKLTCDDECAKTERTRVLADAFGVTTQKLDALHFGENSVISEVLADLLRRDPKWVLSVEERCKFLVLGRVRGGSGAFRVHVFCPMLKEKRDALRLIAERWKLSVNAAGWEPKRLIVVHVTPKSKAPAHVLGAKGSSPVNMLHAPVFDPLTDMDPKPVVALFDLPRDADISALVLSFGGECELVWLNDKNALVVFSDPVRASTAMRRLEQGSVYYGAVVVPQNGGASAASSGANSWGGTGLAKDGGPSSISLKGNPWMKAVVQEHKLGESSWGSGEWFGDSAKIEPSLWKGRDAPIATSANRWSVLDSATTVSSSYASAGIEDTGKLTVTQMVSDFEPQTSCSNMTAARKQP